MQHFFRWLTAVIIIPIILAILFKGSTLLLAVLISVVALLTLREYLTISLNNHPPAPFFTTLVTYITAMSLVMGACLGKWEVQFLVLLAGFCLLSLSVLSCFPDRRDIFEVIAKQAFGIIYIPASLSLLVFIKGMDQGVLWILWLLIVIFANDTGAFYSGTNLGKNDLSPNISPNKTIEGSIGGVTAGVICGFIFSLIFFKSVSIAFLTIPASLLLAAAGQVGDLVESAMKRNASIKDSGRILPGHGGMLDRIDGLLFAIPVSYIYLTFIL